MCKNQKDFCWVCLRDWVSSDSQSCGHEDCEIANERADILKNCPVKCIDAAKGVPETRACPNCGVLTTHEDRCKHMTCRSAKCLQSKYAYCFVCLKPWIGH